jgi:hypothetical protein
MGKVPFYGTLRTADNYFKLELSMQKRKMETMRLSNRHTRPMTTRQESGQAVVFKKPQSSFIGALYFTNRIRQNNLPFAILSHTY